MSREPHIPAEKPFPPFPTSHPILPPDASPADPGRDVQPADDSPGNDVHPHVGNRPPVEKQDRRDGRDA